MNIIFFAHPRFAHHKSMPRFVNMLAAGMAQRGHNVKVWSARGFFAFIPIGVAGRKWLGYIDQFILFPIIVFFKIIFLKKATLFVFTDQALGPLVPLVRNRPNVIHCHDFTAYRQAIGEMQGYEIRKTGRIYQNLIRAGFSQGKNFISVSKNTHNDLKRFLSSKPSSLKIVYNGFNSEINLYSRSYAREYISELIRKPLNAGYFLHVGGNIFYKNRIGLIEIYDNWRRCKKGNYPLLLLGEPPDAALSERISASEFNSDIHLIIEPTDQVVQIAYSGALLFLFPSLAEGFGWPIAEAMAAACLVITSDRAPMTEVGGPAGFYIPIKPPEEENYFPWMYQVNATITRIIEFTDSERESAEAASLLNSYRFDTENALDQIETFYIKILKEFRNILA